MDLKTNEQWARVRAGLREEFGENAYKSWLKPLTLEAVEGGTVHLSVPTRFMRNWIESQYGARLVALWSSENPEIKSVSVRQARQRPTQDAVALEAVAAEANDQNIDLEAVATANLCAPVDPRFTFGSFIVGKPNELAFAAARRVAEAPNVPFNPLFLFGGVGLGKTHLMHAIAGQIRANAPQKRVLYLSAEKFMYQFIRALRYKDTMAFKELFRSVDVLMIDDVQFIAGKENTQEEFFHTFNALLEGGQQMILTCDRYPKEIDGLEERLKSRFGWGLTVAVEPPELETRVAILIKKAHQAKVNLPNDAAFFIAQRINGTINPPIPETKSKNFSF